jgi:putative flippase GtrA
MLFVFKYVLFAIIATAINLLTQVPLFEFMEGPWVLYLALMAGTLTGLITKYMLDKRWIFYYTAKSRQDDLTRFSLYSVMGIITTLIFWGTEAGVFYFFEFTGSQYVGGALGLTIGYTAKYFLDKKYVFRINT